MFFFSRETQRPSFLQTYFILEWGSVVAFVVHESFAFFRGCMIHDYVT